MLCPRPQACFQTRFRFEFLASPVRVLGDWMNGVNALKVEENTLVGMDGNVKARGTGNTRQIEADTIIFAIGDTVDRDFCVPIFNDAYMSAPQPCFPIEGVSYEAFNPDTNQPLTVSSWQVGRAKPVPDWLAWHGGMVKGLLKRSCNSCAPKVRCVIWIM